MMMGCPLAGQHCQKCCGCNGLVVIYAFRSLSEMRYHGVVEHDAP